MEQERSAVLCQDRTISPTPNKNSVCSLLAILGKKAAGGVSDALFRVPTSHIFIYFRSTFSFDFVALGESKT